MGCAKWRLWHRSPYPALQRLESLGWELAPDGSAEEVRLLARLGEFIGYIENNQCFIVDWKIPAKTATEFGPASLPTPNLNAGVWVTRNRDRSDDHSILGAVGAEYYMSKQTTIYSQVGAVNDHGAVTLGSQ
jgi:hypothetical protein